MKNYVFVSLVNDFRSIKMIYILLTVIFLLPYLINYTA